MNWINEFEFNSTGLFAVVTLYGLFLVFLKVIALFNRPKAISPEANEKESNHNYLSIGLFGWNVTLYGGYIYFGVVALGLFLLELFKMIARWVIHYQTGTLDTLNAVFATLIILSLVYIVVNSVFINKKERDEKE